jgi:hypothetical protein
MKWEWMTDENDNKWQKQSHGKKEKVQKTNKKQSKENFAKKLLMPQPLPTATTIEQCQAPKQFKQ